MILRVHGSLLSQIVDGPVGNLTAVSQKRDPRHLPETLFFAYAAFGVSVCRVHAPRSAPEGWKPRSAGLAEHPSESTTLDSNPTVPSGVVARPRYDSPEVQRTSAKRPSRPLTTTPLSWAKGDVKTSDSLVKGFLIESENESGAFFRHVLTVCPTIEPIGPAAAESV